MATTQLKLYNAALRECGERSLANLTEDREPRRKLDEVWDGGRFVSQILEEGDWNFATRSVEIVADAGLTPPFGLPYGFEKPSDWVRTSMVCSDEFFNEPYNRYTDENGNWYAGLDTLYVQYVSNDAAYGLDFSKWPESFTSWAEFRLARKVHKRLTAAKTDYQILCEEEEKLLIKARGKDARAQGAAFMPRGSWSRARQGSRFFDRKDR
jgi:hypothetical protein